MEAQYVPAKHGLYCSKGMKTASTTTSSHHHDFPDKSSTKSSSSHIEDVAHRYGPKRGVRIRRSTLDAALPGAIRAAEVPEDAAVARRAVGLGANGGLAWSSLLGTANCALLNGRNCLDRFSWRSNGLWSKSCQQGRQIGNKPN